MKYIITIFSLIINVSLFGQNQRMSNYEVLYQVKFVQDTTKTDFFNNEILSLLIGENESLFKSTQKVIADSIRMEGIEKAFKENKDGKIILKLPNVSAKFKPEVYKKNDSIIGYSELLTKVYEYPINERLKWKVHDEIKNIEKYKCRKATTDYKGRKYTAWFTSEIPISEGPYIFKGLPGLILEVYDQKEYYLFSLAAIRKVKKPIIPTSSHYKTDYEKFIKTRNNFLADPIGIIENQTNLKISANHRERIIKNNQSKNNYID